MEKNYKFIIDYDGTRYFGWEHQPDKEMTIQGKLETVLHRMLDTPVEITGAGRTDAGVHARGMVAHAHMDTVLMPDEIQEYMNRYLPEDISIREVREASSRFHARYNAIGKTYCYTCYYGRSKPVFERKYVYVLDEKPDIALMRRASLLLTGKHDYASFCGNPKMKKSTVRIVDKIDIQVNGPFIRLYFHGSGFLQHMVRILTGTILETGFGKRDPESMPELLEAKDRSLAGFTAPAQGLCLVDIEYH